VRLRALLSALYALNVALAYLLMLVGPYQRQLEASGAFMAGLLHTWHSFMGTAAACRPEMTSGIVLLRRP
jgi:hypothetical protein